MQEDSCSVGEGELAFFWEFADAAVYLSGAVVLMARDAATAKNFAEVATPVD